MASGGVPLLIAASCFVSSTLPTLLTVIHGYCSSNDAKILSKSSSSAFDVHALHSSIVTGSCDASARYRSPTVHRHRPRRCTLRHQREGGDRHQPSLHRVPPSPSRARMPMTHLIHGVRTLPSSFGVSCRTPSRVRTVDPVPPATPSTPSRAGWLPLAGSRPRSVAGTARSQRRSRSTGSSSRSAFPPIPPPRITSSGSTTAATAAMARAIRPASMSRPPSAFRSPLRAAANTFFAVRGGFIPSAGPCRRRRPRSRRHRAGRGGGSRRSGRRSRPAACTRPRRRHRCCPGTARRSRTRPMPTPVPRCR